METASHQESQKSSKTSKSKKSKMDTSKIYLKAPKTKWSVPNVHPQRSPNVHIILQIYIAYTSINKTPLFLSNSFLLFIVVIICKNIVTNININKLPLKSVANVKGFITAPKPISKHKFNIFDPVIFPSSKSGSPLLADIIPVIISGNAVPIATIVIPINLSDKPKVSAIIIALSTTKS